ncbi:hypothetical protein [Streptomyces litchfieldiae]|uniref:Anti-sigma factor n=1 Tax=Streptomyces litchfieldiae TaxID=3075543 RepID=A0ABU2MTJ1_9ACTN|nr:hypothetical protein [Streptomyces sp. DSM 44938]MDT0344845.1 hypothetical protein [Streptomyces sp. DSM 44938]
MADRPEVREMLRAAAAGHEPDRRRMLARVERAIAAAPARRGGWLRVAGAAAALAVTLGAAALIAGWSGGGPGGAGPAAAETRLPSSGVVDPGSNPHWSQSNITVETAEPLTSFTVELRVVTGEGVRPTGAWRTLPGNDFDLSVANEGGDLVFRWELRPGAEVPPGEHMFAGQFDHDLGARDPSGDRYRVTGSGPAGTVSASGGFGAATG